MKAVLDTSILIGEQPLPPGIEAAISAMSLAELHFGVLATADPRERARRTARLGLVEASFDALPLDERVARALGQIQAAVADGGRNPRPRTADLAIAATAMAHEAVLLTTNSKDFRFLEDLVEIRVPFA
ncbi:MAG TPA: PIN domain-containing protein [Solirubrobacterales bacterium]|nr:PIN domain-containing protein [Solirubrobacterales bacterium]